LFSALFFRSFACAFAPLFTMRSGRGESGRRETAGKTSRGGNGSRGPGASRARDVGKNGSARAPLEPGRGVEAHRRGRALRERRQRRGLRVRDPLRE
jgi:hypothetical protein